jgi:PIN domain nuclease of toxin-antitoxin system
VIALDTHALVWWVADPDRIPAPARRRVNAAVKAGERLSVSCISVWEIAMLVERGRLQLTMPVDAWLRAVDALPFLSFVPVDNGIALRSVQLPQFPHRDPADRIIVATALGQGATLVTADRRLHAYSPLTTVWD